MRLSLLFVCSPLLAVSAPCTALPSFPFASGAHLAPSVQLSWTPACQFQAAQFYDGGGRLLTDRQAVDSGQLNLSDLAGAYTGAGALKFWYSNGSSAVIPIIVDVCANPQLIFKQDELVSPDTYVSWSPGNCTAVALIAYRNNQLVAKIDLPISGRVKIRDLYSACDGPIVISLFTGGTTPSSSVSVVIRVNASWSFAEGFERPFDPAGCPARPQLTTEIVKPGCFVSTGASSRIDGSNGSASGSQALTVRSDPGGGKDVHVSYNQKVLASVLPAGDWVVAVWAKIRGTFVDLVQTGPEYAFAMTRLFSDGWGTTEAGIQYQSGCRWAVWTDWNSPVARWLTLDEPFCLTPEAFHKLSFSFHYEDLADNVYYKSFSVNETRVVDLSRYHVPTLKKFTEYAGVYSLEVEALDTCSSNASAAYEVTYDALSIQQETHQFQHPR